MTVGNPGKQIVAFTVPMLIGNIAQQLYNTADSIIVGRFVGDNALAAVGSAGPIINLLMVLFVGVSVGASIMVSQFYGARQREELARSIGTCISLTALSSLIIMIITPFVAMPLLRLLNTPESIIHWCHEYLLILMIGCAGSAFYNILGGVLRGLGDSASALLYLLVATFLNIFLDYIFVAWFNMGVPGVAWATIIAQFVSALLSLRKLMRMPELFTLRKDHLKLDRDFTANLIKLGLPSGLTQAIFSCSMLIVQTLTNSFGEQYIAANVIVMRIDGFVMMPAFSFGTAMTTYAGQNIGAKQLERVRQGTKQGTTIAVCVSVVLTVLIILFGRHVMAIFTETEALIELSYTMMCIMSTGYIAMEITQCLSGVMRGAGDTMTPMWISLINTVAIRVPLAYGMVALTKTPELPQGNCLMMNWSLLITWIIGAVLTFIAFRLGKWRKKARAAMEMMG
ncbi:MAG: MATE family efflux transporter [Oscillospiraceae bacterium]|nr:MATE family efflux transporter [Oscillospiraceae bacterium]